MALPLTEYLVLRQAQDDSGGSYVGFDIVKKGVEWCRENITAGHPNFTFIHADIVNPFYNPKGMVAGDAYVFPAKGGEFDFCFATSVFTHMLQGEVERYIKETARVARQGGTVFFTFFLIPSTAGDSYKTDACDFKYRLGDALFYSHKDCIEAEVGYSEKWVRSLLEHSGLGDIKIYSGRWKDPHGFSYQDIIVARKRGV